MGALTRFLTSAKTSWIILVITALAATALFALAGSEESETAPSVGLPSSAESVKVDQLLEEFPSADATSALLVFASEDGVLDEKTLSLIDQKAFGDLAALALDGAVPPAQVSDDGTVALVVVPLEPEPDVAEQTARAEEIRDIAAVFDGADFTLLLTTVIVVAVLLLITYRSPWLWIVPLVVIGLADALAGIVARQVASAVGIQLDASITGILSVLVSFGPGRCRRCDRGCD